MLSRIAALFQGKKLDSDLDEELEAQIDLAIAENLKAGMTTAFDPGDTASDLASRPPGHSHSQIDG